MEGNNQRRKYGAGCGDEEGKKTRICRKLRVYDEIVQDKRKARYLGVVLVIYVQYKEPFSFLYVTMYGIYTVIAIILNS